MECENSIRNSDSPRHLLRNFEKEPVTILCGSCEEVLEICRNALVNKDKQRYRMYAREISEILSYAIAILSNLGKVSDILILKEFVNDDTLGRSAIDSIKKIEERGYL